MALTRVNTVASKGGYQLEGVAELKKALAILGDEVATKEGRRANRRAANLMANELRASAPRGDEANRSEASKKYGRLSDNIRVRLAKARKESTITYNVTTGRAFWGFFLEFGTINMPARPWMRVTFDGNTRAAVDSQMSELKSGVERAAKKAFRASGGK
jgi:HK97 gp10 family phage protein